jgi:hypothetical protein
MPAQRLHACRGSTRSQAPPRTAQRSGGGLRVPESGFLPQAEPALPRTGDGAVRGSTRPRGTSVSSAWNASAAPRARRGWGRPASCPPGAALASSRSSAPGGHAAARPPARAGGPAAPRSAPPGGGTAPVWRGYGLPWTVANRSTDPGKSEASPPAFASRDLTQQFAASRAETPLSHLAHCSTRWPAIASAPGRRKR